MKVLVGVLVLSLYAISEAAFAQETAPPRPTANKPIKEVIQALGKAAGVEILIDSTLSQERTAFKETTVTRATLEAALDKLVETLPPGTAWAKTYLPEPPPGKKYNGDALAQYVMAQATLFGKAGISEPGKVELLGKQVPTDRAQATLSELKLRPYYVLRCSGYPVLSNRNLTKEFLNKISGTDFMEVLMKQLNASSPDQIRPGNYKVFLPGPDGKPVSVDLTVDDSVGDKRVMLRRI
ncbi:MAG: hypothetical protein QM758_10955 [Armatimonas sp.]